MKVKKFTGSSMPEAMLKVKKELGPDAVILNSKMIKVGGFMGFFKRNQTEVIAAVDPAQEGIRETATAKEKPVTPPHFSLPMQHEELLRELKSIKSMMGHQDHSTPTYLSELHDHLHKQEVDPDLVLNLLEELQDDDSYMAMTPVEWKNRLIQFMYKKVEHLPFGSPTFEKQVIQLVGPTGVGKTTTLAKLAADAALNKKMSVAFITTDTYRIAAIDQLKTYAKILDIPIEVAYSMEEYREAKRKFRDYDLILVDTAGRNFRDPTFVKELNDVIEYDQDTETFLVLSLTSKYSDLEDIYHQFKSVPLKQLIFTKADETASYGNALNMCIHHNIGVAFLTNGQNVPDDIIEATPMRLSRKVMEGYHNG